MCHVYKYTYRFDFLTQQTAYMLTVFTVLQINATYKQHNFFIKNNHLKC